mgnify:CR=1 FL=1
MYDSVLVPAIAWPTTIWPLIQLGLNPIFIDVNKDTLAIDLEVAQNLIDNSGISVRGIFPIHPLGYALPHIELEKFIQRNDLILINDVCESLGSWRDNKHAGIVGLAASFSFYFSHHITTMEGGGVATNDDNFADDLRSIRSHGWSRDRMDVKEWNKHVSTNDSKFLFVSTGYNVRPMEIQAAIGSLQIDSIDEFINRRRFIAKSVSTALEGSSLELIGSRMLEDKVYERAHSWMLLPLRVKGENSLEKKNRLLKELDKLEIETRPVLTGNFLAQPAIQRITKHQLNPEKYEVASMITKNSFLVGAHHDLGDEQIDYLSSSLQKLGQL